MLFHQPRVMAWPSFSVAYGMACRPPGAHDFESRIECAYTSYSLLSRGGSQNGAAERALRAHVLCLISKLGMSGSTDPSRVQPEDSQSLTLEAERLSRIGASLFGEGELWAPQIRVSYCYRCRPLEVVRCKRTIDVCTWQAGSEMSSRR